MALFSAKSTVNREIRLLPQGKLRSRTGNCGEMVPFSYILERPRLQFTVYRGNSDFEGEIRPINRFTAISGFRIFKKDEITAF